MKLRCICKTQNEKHAIVTLIPTITCSSRPLHHRPWKHSVRGSIHPHFVKRGQGILFDPRFSCINQVLLFSLASVKEYRPRLAHNAPEFSAIRGCCFVICGGVLRDLKGTAVKGVWSRHVQTHSMVYELHQLSSHLGTEVHGTASVTFI